jgi:hypothetical protein
MPNKCLPLRRLSYWPGMSHKADNFDLVTRLLNPRHLHAIEEEIWAVGRDVASTRRLYGRADIRANDCSIDSLKVFAKPLPNNPNHADIEGWPLHKPDQKAIALKLAASASKLILPPAPDETRA